jgi:hypothetical protein
MPIALIIILGAAALWDGFTTIYGTLQILGTDVAPVIASLLCGALILSLLLNTKRIMSWESDFSGGLLRLFWFIAVAYDLYTSWMGNQTFLVKTTINDHKLAVLAGVTLLISGSPIVLSLLWEKLMAEL